MRPVLYPQNPAAVIQWTIIMKTNFKQSVMVNNSTNINKKTLNGDGQQFHQYQQKNFKRWWSTIPPISTKQTLNGDGQQFHQYQQKE
jgi:hypothetical protein